MWLIALTLDQRRGGQFLQSCASSRDDSRRDRVEDVGEPHFTTGRSSSGPVEAINGEIEQVDRAARGFRNVHNYRTRMLLKTAVVWQTPTTPRLRGHAPQDTDAAPAFIA